MNSTTSKRFHVIITDCENQSHADKIAELLDAFHPTERRPASVSALLRSHCGFSMKVEADSQASIEAAIAPALGNAKVQIHEVIARLGEPPPYTK